uniref:RNA-directed DNA polymerase, eukaryota, reverse transcriptase zinc-binding domain protein n=1 Tax=Tanacetum cinerariifolium TaxID=118510 RepID=A0A6L2JFH7_TANCI|nr:RNA-directed DNA polymerase, eukaryota, reverse transcriptase zinc-binding domain protein [Tanacetum cinerariifolium]
MLAMLPTLDGLLRASPKRSFTLVNFKLITIDYRRECQQSNVVDLLSSREPLNDTVVSELKNGNGSSALQNDRQDMIRFLHLLRSSDNGLEISRSLMPIFLIEDRKQVNDLVLYALSRFQREPLKRHSSLHNIDGVKRGNSRDTYNSNGVKSAANSYAHVVKGSQNSKMVSDSSPVMVLDDSCLNEKYYSLCLLGNVKDFATLANLKVVVANEGFDNIKFKYMGGYWIQLASSDFNTDGRVTWVEIKGGGFRVGSYEDVPNGEDVKNVEDLEGDSNGELVHDTEFEEDFPNQKGKEDSVRQGNVQSDDPSNIYELLNHKRPVIDKNSNSKKSLKYPPGYTPTGSKEATGEKQFDSKFFSKNDAEESICSVHFKKFKVPKSGGSILQLIDDLVKVGETIGASVSNSGGILYVWDPNMFKKMNSTVSYYFVMVRGDWMPNGKKLLIISVYAPQELSEKKMLWDYLSLVMSNWEGELSLIMSFEINSEAIMFTDSSDDEEVTSRHMTFFSQGVTTNARQANRSRRNTINRDRYGTHERLLQASFLSVNPMFLDETFDERFRMSRRLLTRIVEEIYLHSTLFRNKRDCAEIEGISPLMKCTSAIRQLTYDTVPNFMDEYLQIGHETSRLCLEIFCICYVTRLMIWHAFFGALGVNDIHVIHQSPLFNDFKEGKAPEIPFVVNNVAYPWGYYLVDVIYPKWLTLVKTISNVSEDDRKQIWYKRMQEAARKDVERAFGVLKKKGDAPIIESNALVRMMKKLKYLKEKIRMWNKLNKEKSHKSKRSLIAELADCDAIIDKGEGENNIVNRRTEVVNLLQKVEKKNSLEAAQKAKIKWAIEGDENSKYYHGVINKKRNQLSIRGILVEVSKEEIKKAVWDCEIDKSPGLDGITFGFYRRYWKLIENDVVDAVTCFFHQDCFNRASGLRINMTKSKLLGISAKDDKVKQAAAKIGCNTLKTPFSYLGSKVGGLKSQFWVKWKHALASKDKGGLGVSSLFALNRALMFKWVKSCYPSLWLDIIHEVEMFKSRGIDLVSLIHSKLGNGANTSFWEVAWRRDHRLDVSFRRPPRGGVEIQQFEHMKEKVEGCVLADMMDSWF